MEKNLQIIVAGQVATGKSTIMYAIQQFLIEKGFEAEISFENQNHEMPKYIERFLVSQDERMAALKSDKLKITLRSEQLKSDYKKKA